MPLNTNATSLVNQMNGALPAQLADAFRALGIGSVLRALRTTLRNKSPNAAPTNPYCTASTQVLTLPDDAKASVIARAYARTGTGTAGPLTIVAPDSFAGDPTASHLAVTPSGDLMFHAADAYTSVDIEYEPLKYDIKEVTIPCLASGITPLPAADVAAGVVFIAEAEGNYQAAGDAQLIVNLPGTAAAASHAALDLAKANVVTTAAAYTTIRVKYGVACKIDVDATLEAASTIL